MEPHEKKLRRRRDSGLAGVRSWTSGSVFAGLVLTGVLGAETAHLLPGQDDPARSANGPATSSSARPAPAVGTHTPAGRHEHENHSDDDGGGDDRGGRSSLTPPSSPPAPAPHTHHAQPPVTSGGS